MSKKFVLLTLILVTVAVAGVFVWRSQDQKAKAAKTEAEILRGISAVELNTILKSQEGASVDIAATAESRKLFLQGMREHLALAAQARREGLAEDPNFKLNFEYKKRILLADMYSAKLAKDNGSPYRIPDAEIEAVWKNPENENQFKAELAAIRNIQLEVARQKGHDEATVPELGGGALVKARTNWSRTKVMADKAAADAEFMARPEIPLRTRVFEAGILSSDYLRKYWPDRVKATDQEIAGYLGSHPELDVKKKYEKAVSVLQRVKAGEDFAKLAREISEDRTSKVDGGLYKDVTKDLIWIEVEKAALALENGQLADGVIESNTGYHVVKLDNKRVEKDANGKEQVKFNVRHILLQKFFEDPSHHRPEVPAPFLSAEEIARAAIEKEKRRQFIDGIIEKNHVELPEDFVLN